MENNNYKNFMLLAIEEAKIASKENEVPVGAVVVYKQQVIAKSGNLVLKYSNPLMHAEMIVLKKDGGKKVGFQTLVNIKVN